jgi:hypothetical protein
VFILYDFLSPIRVVVRIRRIGREDMTAITASKNVNAELMENRSVSAAPTEQARSILCAHGSGNIHTLLNCSLDMPTTIRVK